MFMKVFAVTVDNRSANSRKVRSRLTDMSRSRIKNAASSEITGKLLAKAREARAKEPSNGWPASR